MGLINLQTNLKSLKFGNDRIHGGSSNQPYIISPIPDGDTSLIPNQDFILRGGLYSVKNTTEDVLRLTKYFNDLKSPSGLLFVAKQNLLSRTAVRTQSSTGILNEGIYTPLSTLAQASVSAFGLHFNKQGFNPIPDTPGSIRTYSDIVKVGSSIPSDLLIEETSTNRLVRLTRSKITDELSYNPITTGISPLSTNILTYIGGPNSLLGIGNTNIRFADQRIISNATVAGVFPNSNRTTTYTQNELSTISTTPQSDGESFLIQNGKYGATTTPGDFRSLLRKRNELITAAPNYTKKNIEQRVNLGDPGNDFGKNISSYTSGSFKGAASENSYDKINVLPIYQSETAAITTDKPVNDLIKFRIGVYDLTGNENIPKNYIHFRAFLNNISDGYSSDWNSTQYIGRGEKFYTYAGFDRKISLSWTVAAQSKIELIPMYKKLNYLASVCAPDYSNSGYMRGNIITLTIGGYLYEQPGIITGFNYEMNDDNATWEIGINDEGNYDESVKELPHLIKVTGFNFIPIHNFVPRSQQNIFDKNGILTNYGPERYIALSNGKGINSNNYDS